MLVFAATEYINLSWLSSSAAIFFCTLHYTNAYYEFPCVFFRFRLSLSTGRTTTINCYSRYLLTFPLKCYSTLVSCPCLVDEQNTLILSIFFVAASPMRRIWQKSILYSISLFILFGTEQSTTSSTTHLMLVCVVFAQVEKHNVWLTISSTTFLRCLVCLRFHLRVCVLVAPLAVSTACHRRIRLAAWQPCAIRSQ